MSLWHCDIHGLVGGNMCCGKASRVEHITPGQILQALDSPHGSEPPAPQVNKDFAEACQRLTASLNGLQSTLAGFTAELDRLRGKT